MHGDRLILAETLIAVLETGSFTDAATKLGVSQSTVSRRVAALENKLGGTQLFHRGTRWIDATQEAKSYVRDIRGVIAQLESAEAKIRDLTEIPRGQLRVSMPPAIGRAKLIMPVVRLVERYPELNLRIDLSEEFVDLREGGVDLAIRIRPIEQTGIVVEKIGESRIGLYASPQYLAAAPPLKDITDLTIHRLIGLTSFFERDLGNLPRKYRQKYADIRPSILANDLTAIRTMLLEGLGVGFLPELIVESDILDESLVDCNVKIPIAAMQLFVIYPHGLRGAARLEAVLSELRQIMSH